MIHEALKALGLNVWGGGEGADGRGPLWEECFTVCIHDSFIVLKMFVF